MQYGEERATADTALNRANELNAKAVLDVSNEQYDNLWQFYADTMEWAWKSAESEQARLVELGVANINADASQKLADAQRTSASTKSIGGLIGQLGSMLG